MATRTVDERELYHQKRLLAESEEAFYAQKKHFRERGEQLAKRHSDLAKMIEVEQDKMRKIVTDLGLSMADARDFFNELDQLSAQSNGEFQWQRHQLQEAEEEARRAFRQSQAKMEEQLQKLRRDYASTAE